MVAWLDRPYLNADCDTASGRDAYIAGLAGITEIEVIESHPCGCYCCTNEREERARQARWAEWDREYDRGEP